MLKFLLPHWIHNMKHAFMKFVLRTRSLWNALSAGNRLDIGQCHVGELCGVFLFNPYKSVYPAHQIKRKNTSLSSAPQNLTRIVLVSEKSPAGFCSTAPENITTRSAALRCR